MRILFQMMNDDNNDIMIDHTDQRVKYVCMYICTNIICVLCLLYMIFFLTKNPFKVIIIYEKNMTSLPHPEQNWAHSTCCKEELKIALNDPIITAIEADILMGYDLKDVDKCNIRPIMAHPPMKTSDLVFESFLDMSCNSYNVYQDSKDNNDEDDHHINNVKKIQKHLKLDFKEIETIEPVLNYISQTILCHCNSSSTDDLDGSKSETRKTIYLNADILRGPGMRHAHLPISSDEFLKECLPFLKDHASQRHMFAFSLGWRVDCRSFFGYTDNDIQLMKDIIKDHNLLSYCQGIVLAANARILAKNPFPFDSILKEIPQLQLLVWTGTGEPQISEQKLTYIRNHFQSAGCLHQVGFDCKVASSYFSGIFYDSAVQTVGLFWNTKKFFFRQLNSMMSNYINHDKLQKK